MAAFLLTINIFNRFMFVYFGVFFSCSKTMCRCLRVAVKRVLSTTLDGQEWRSLRLLVSHAWMRLLSLPNRPDMTFAVHWALKTIIYPSTKRPRCVTTLGGQGSHSLRVEPVVWTRVLTVASGRTPKGKPTGSTAY